MSRLVKNVFSALVLSAAFVSMADAQGTKDTYEFRGKIRDSGGNSFDGVVPIVFLHGSTIPFATKTTAGPGGDFRFRNLRPGMYTLVIAVPRAGELQQTVEVGPSHADSKRRIEKLFVFDHRPLPADNAHRVSVAELAVPASARREYGRAQSRLEKHDVAGAVERLKKAIEIAPKFAAAWNNLGTIAYQAQDYEEAEKYFRESLNVDPEFYPPLVNLGGTLLSGRKVEEALPFNEAAARARPDDALAHSQLGQNLFFLGRFEEAVLHLKQAKALDPAHFSFPQLILAEIYGRQGDIKSQIGELEEFLRYHPDSHLAPKVKQTIAKVRAVIGLQNY
ncbi:MAG: tetratricopeptide repeat protein [Acidobacteria bacterium]|nr:tetratricopeptide repeat protein [Acidobacteriota bacterium]